MRPRGIPNPVYDPVQAKHLKDVEFIKKTLERNVRLAQTRSLMNVADLGLAQADAMIRAFGTAEASINILCADAPQRLAAWKGIVGAELRERLCFLLTGQRVIFEEAA